jgi:hypothetical protein
VYHIEVKTGDFAGEKQYLTQISENGEVKKTVLAIGDDYGKSLLSVFCDEQYLYFLASQNGNEYHEKKKVNEKVILNRFAHSGLSHKKFVLDLPALSDPATSSFWSFAGQNKQGKYLVSKRLQPEISQQTVDLVTFNAEGKVTGKLTLSYDSSEKFIRPASSISLNEGKEFHMGSRNLVNINFEPTSSVPLTMTSQAPGPAAGPATVSSFGGSSAWHTNAAFGYLHIDASDAIYIYGLSGPKPFKRVGSGYEGFYVYKYDINGNQIWKLRSEGTKELLETKFYTTHGRPQDRYIGLYSHPNQRLTFSIAVTANLSAKPDVFLFDISEQGQIAGTHSTKEAAGESAVLVSLTPKAKEYVKKQPLGKSSAAFAHSFVTPSGEVLLMGGKEGKLHVLFFE